MHTRQAPPSAVDWPRRAERQRFACVGMGERIAKPAASGLQLAALVQHDEIAAVAMSSRTLSAAASSNRSAARALLWNSGDLTFSARRRNTTATGDSAAAVGAILHRYKFDRGRVHRRDRPGCRRPAARRRSAASRSARLDRGHFSTGASRNQHLSPTQSRPAPDRPEENCEGPAIGAFLL